MTTAMPHRLLIVSALLSALTACGTIPASPRVLEIHMQVSAGGFAQLYWNEGAGFKEELSVRQAVQPGSTIRVALPLPERAPTQLRFDPMDSGGEVRISRANVRLSTGELVAPLDPLSFSLGPGVKVLEHGSNGLLLQTDRGNTDPILYVTPACLEGPSSAWSLRTVTPFSLLLSSVAILALLGFVLAQVVRAAAGVHGYAGASRRGNLAQILLWLAGASLVIFGARLWLISTAASAVPYLDPWLAEVDLLYGPYHYGCLAWERMFAPHNEHRIFFTRWLALGLFQLNGQWDPQLQTVVNAAIQTITAALLMWIAYASLGRRRLEAVVALVLLTFAAPFSWENTLAGFQSQFYFGALLGLAGVALVAFVPPSAGAGWLAAWLAACLSLVTSGGGVIVVPAMCLGAMLWCLEPANGWRRSVAAIGALTLPLAAGFWLRVPSLVDHQALGAQDATALIGSLLSNLAWPWIRDGALALPMWAPVVGVCLRVAIRRRCTASDRLVLMLGAWVVAQALAIAVTRGADGAAPASRYMDILVFGLIANAIAALSLLEPLAAPPFKRRIVGAAVAAWVAVAALGLDRLTNEELQLGASTRRRWLSTYQANLRRFLATDDVEELARHPFPVELPFYDARQLAAWMRHPYVRAILPAPIRPPLAFAPRPSAGGAFTQPGTYPSTPSDAGRPSWGSYSEDGNRGVGDIEGQLLECEGNHYLRFEVAGFPSQPGMVLALTDPETGGRDHAVFRSDPKEDWGPLHMRCPHEPFTVFASDTNASSWFAFRSPVEEGRWSVWASRAIVRHRPLILVGVLALLVALRRQGRFEPGD